MVFKNKILNPFIVSVLLVLFLNGNAVLGFTGGPLRPEPKPLIPPKPEPKPNKPLERVKCPEPLCENGKVKLPGKPANFDLQKAQQWVNAHPEKFRPVAEVLKNATVEGRITMERQIDNLDRAVTAALESNKIGDSSTRAILVESADPKDLHSDLYFSLLAQEGNSKFAEIPIFTEEAFLQNLTNPETAKITTLYYVDDAAYSGGQLAGRARNLAELINPIRPDIRLEVIVGFATESGKTRILTSGEITEPSFISGLHVGEIVPTIADFFKQDPIANEIFQENKTEFEYNGLSDWKTTTTTDWKTPDGVSVFNQICCSSLTNGQLLLPADGKYSWVPIIKPPYSFSCPTPTNPNPGGGLIPVK